MPNHVASLAVSSELVANGYAWRYEYTGSLAAAASEDVGLTTGPSGCIISDRQFSTDSTDTTFVLYRATAWTGGVAQTLANRSDRFWADSSRSAVLTLSKGVTATPSAANAMGTIRLRGATGNAISLASEASDIYLAPNSSYLIRVTNTGTGAAIPLMSILFVRDQVSTGNVRIG
jgi:hypothetical protein